MIGALPSQQGKKLGFSPSVGNRANSCLWLSNIGRNPLTLRRKITFNSFGWNLDLCIPKGQIRASESRDWEIGVSLVRVGDVRLPHGAVCAGRHRPRRV